MTRDAQLQFCTKCIKRSFSHREGVICSLTGTVADFEISCPSFEQEAGMAPFPVDSTPYDYSKKTYNPELHLSDAGKRFLTYLIDSVILFILVLIFTIIGSIFIYSIYGEELNENSGSFVILYYGLYAILYFGYYGFMESGIGKTVGKLIMGTKVVTAGGETPDFGTCLLRTLIRLVPFEAFSMLGSNARGWHDSWTNTYVVDAKSN